MLHNLVQLIEQYTATPSFMAFPLAFLGGILTSFTPCVYPVIPIVVGYIGGQGKKSKWSGFLLSSAYVFGMAITYSALGVFAALTGRFFGQIQNNPWVNLVVGNIIILFGLSMLDLFPISLPAFFHRSGEKKLKPGFRGAFSLGIASGFITAPCTVAILGALLTIIAAKQNIFFGVSLLFVYAVGMGFILILAGTFTGFLISLPKSGKWLKRVQNVFGFFMIALGEYYIFQAGRLW